MTLSGRFTKIRFVFLLTLISLTLSSVVIAAPDQRGLAVVDKDRDSRKRVALVIGNSNYLSSPLKNPVNDAHAMANALRKLGFEVDEEINLGYIGMNKSVESFRKKLSNGGVGLFYYAGHGMQVNGNNYLIPVDSQIEDENEVIYKAVDAGLVLAKMEQSKTDVNLVILDACRDNPFPRSFRSSSRGLAQINAPTGTLISYATAPGKTASDGKGKNGVYTEALIEAMQSPGLKVEEVFKMVRRLVLEKTANDQVPWESSSLVGDFHFIQPSSMTDIMPTSMTPRPMTTPKKQLPGRPVIEESATPVAAIGFTDSTTGMEFVNVPGGCFQMGNTFDTGNDDEKPAHEACVSDFAIGKYEVTQSQWRKVMGNNPSHFSSCGDNCPVENISWNDVQIYIKKLNQQTSGRFRLPTEAEWEYAARSGGRNEKYSGGKDRDSVAWNTSNSSSKTHSVGQKNPNGLGIYDMSGNVWELVSDWYGAYSSAAQTNPTGPTNGSHKVLRGGSGFANSGTNTSQRSQSIAEGHGGALGFRLASPVQ